MSVSLQFSLSASLSQSFFLSLSLSVSLCAYLKVMPLPSVLVGAHPSRSVELVTLWVASRPESTWLPRCLSTSAAGLAQLLLSAWMPQ